MKQSRLVSFLCAAILSVVTPTSHAEARFLDVPVDHWAFSYIETLAASGITTGCGPNIYCPEDSVTRAQMAVFLERGIRGSSYVPDPGVGNIFLDVPASYWAGGWIELLSGDGITTGCGPNIYCPEAAVTREQMAVFLLRAKYGQGYAPPTPTGVFNDVELSHWAAPWIEQLAAEGITTGCGPNIYCPKNSVTRDQMAVFLVRTFDGAESCPGIPTINYAGETYNTVQIGSQCWLKENLNVGTMITTSQDQERNQTNNGAIEKYCYDNDSENCDNFGGLYQWDEAMQYSGSQDICPEDWHIPTLADFETLKNAVNSDGNSLKSIGEGSGSGTATNTNGFSALLAGYVFSDVFSYAGDFASFWSSTEGGFNKVNSMFLNYYDSEIGLASNAKSDGFSVRCVMD